MKHSFPRAWLGLLCATTAPFFSALSFVKAEPPPGPVRDIQVLDKTIWVVGDGGTILWSRDGGETFTTVEKKRFAGMNIQALRKDTPAICLLGGRAVEGFPGGGALGELLRSDDGGKTFAKIPTGGIGWIYDGIMIRDSALLAGQAVPFGPSGVYHTVDAGAHWNSVSLRGKGYLRAAVFDGFRFGYLVGANRRIVSLRNFGEPEYHPAPVASTAELQAVTLVGKTAGWCVGRDGSVLASQPGTVRWTQKLLPIPAGTRRLMDFETIDVQGKHFCIAGGRTGLMFFSDDAGNTFTARTAPGPGPVHVVRYVPGPEGKPRLLAGGDAGRVWSSDDQGHRWRLVHGSGKTDVLFIVAAGDTSIYPAVVAHSAAGLSTAVVYATVPRNPETYPAVPADQWLRAAATCAGAGGATSLTDFPSIVRTDNTDSVDAKNILDDWSKQLDSPAEPILREQLAAAIRQYRPTVLVVGPDGERQKGVAAENHLVARLAQQAAVLAGDAKSSFDLPKALLPPHVVQRIYVGLPGNAKYIPPWEVPPALPRGKGLVRIYGTGFPRGRATCVEMLAQKAIWMLGNPSLLNRPAQVTAYDCRTTETGGELFTHGLGTNFYRKANVGNAQKMLASGANLRMACTQDRIMNAMSGLLRDAEEKGEEGLVPSILAADRMLLLWRRLSQQGEMVRAIQVRDEFLRAGKSHPLFQAINVHTLAATCSVEYNAQRVRRSPDASPMDAVAARAVKKFSTWHPWSDVAAGRMLLTRTILATASPNEIPKARLRALKVLGTLAQGAYPDVWRRMAAFEADCLNQRPHRPVGRAVLYAPFVNQAGKIDGLLNEDAWKTAPGKMLLSSSGTPKREAVLGQVQVIRTPGSIVLGLRVPARAGRTWRVTAAVDADRDAWTQLQIEFDTTGKKAAYLSCRLGPRTKLQYLVQPNNRLFYLQAPRTLNADGQQTFELAIPIHQAGGKPRDRGLWNFQIRATAEDPDGTVQHIYYQPQSAPELLPERFGLLEYPPAI